MARGNRVILHGVLEELPIIEKSEDGHYKSCRAKLRVVRDREDGDGRNAVAFNYPVIYTRSPSSVAMWDTLKQYDYVAVKGFVATKTVKKGAFCPVCGQKNIIIGQQTYVVPIDVEVIHSFSSREEAYDHMRKHPEMSNLFTGIGDLVTDPSRKNIAQADGAVIKLCEYKAALHRTFFVPEDDPDKNVDFTWIKSYGSDADEDYYRLKVKSEIMIDGFLQTRHVQRHAKCGAVSDPVTGRFIRNGSGEMLRWNDVENPLFAADPETVYAVYACEFRDRFGTRHSKGELLVDDSKNPIPYYNVKNIGCSGKQGVLNDDDSDMPLFRPDMKHAYAIYAQDYTDRNGTGHAAGDPVLSSDKRVPYDSVRYIRYLCDDKGFAYDEKGNLRIRKDGMPVQIPLKLCNFVGGCGSRYDWKDETMEIVPYEREYVKEYRTKEQIEELKRSRQEQSYNDLMKKYRNSYLQGTEVLDEDDE